MSGKGGSNRKNRHRFSGRKDDGKKHEKKQSDNFFSDGKSDKNRQNEFLQQHDRPKWTAPVLPAAPVLSHNCKWCGKPITEINIALSDKETELPVHFECVIARITQMEQLETNESICYLGGGRFGVVHDCNPQDMKNFTIKRIHEWEEKENIKEWRRPICEYYSLT
ncbi:MAG: hypothetical protein LBU66_00795 [Treponema sp.]|jgi:hypothetical protein|nr:hypothetical protein [Treponema sp.]